MFFSEIITVYFNTHDNDHVNGVRLCLRTAAIQQIIYEHGQPRWNDIDRRKLLIRPLKLCGKPVVI
jgi:hypothetical protein